MLWYYKLYMFSAYWCFMTARNCFVFASYCFILAKYIIVTASCSIITARFPRQFQSLPFFSNPDHTVFKECYFCMQVTSHTCGKHSINCLRQKRLSPASMSGTLGGWRTNSMSSPNNNSIWWRKRHSNYRRDIYMSENSSLHMKRYDPGDPGTWCGWVG